MKKIMILSCVSMMLLTACVTVESDTSNINENYIFSESTKDKKDGSTEHSDSVVEEVNQGEHIQSINELDAEILLLRNEKGYYQDLVHTPFIDDELFQLELPLTSDKLESIDNIEARSKLTELMEKGYRITDEHEYFGVQIDYEKLMHTSENASNPTRDFIEINYYFDVFNSRLQRLEPVNMDELVSMIIRVEDHFAKWPMSQYKMTLNRLYKNQLMLYFLGNDMYEVYDFSTNKMYEERFELIKKHLKLYSESYFAQVGMKYVLSLEENEYSYHPEYIQIINNFKKFGLESHMKLVEKKELSNTKSIFLPEIQGHENVTIQESINRILRDEVKNIMLETGYSDTSDGTFYFNTFIYTATPEFISIECMGSHNLKDWTLDQSASSTLNFDVRTGEPLTLERYLKQDLDTLNGWLLPIINKEFDKYFGEYAQLSSLEGVHYLVQEDALLIIGAEPTYRAYVPRWILKDYLEVNELFD